MKKNVQKTIAVLGAAVLATGMVGCGSSNTNTSAADTSADSSAAESGAAADTTENSADTKDLSGSIVNGTTHVLVQNKLPDLISGSLVYCFRIPAGRSSDHGSSFSK